MVRPLQLDYSTFSHQLIREEYTWEGGKCFQLCAPCLKYTLEKFMQQQQQLEAAAAATEATKSSNSDSQLAAAANS